MTPIEFNRYIEEEGSRSGKKLAVLARAASALVDKDPTLLQRVQSIKIDWRTMPCGEYAPTVDISFKD